jgi:L,D-transpeptidase catalytic domain
VRVKFPLALAFVVLVSTIIGWALGQGGPPAIPRPVDAPHRQVPRYLARLPAGWSYIAVARGRSLAVYRRPGRHPGRPLKVLTTKLSAGSPLALRVRHARMPWIEIYLPIRPNDSSGWVRVSAVKLLTTPWALTVRLNSHRLLVSRANRLVRNLSIGVGQAVTPTPTGVYFITELLKQPDPTGLYGPYAFGLSAYSGVLSHFGRGGNGQIGIHGTDQPWLVGTNVSHGCIRLRNRDIIWLTKQLPLGTPVRINRD